LLDDAGKTLQVIAFIQAFMAQKLGRWVLVLMPVNTLNNWEQEFEKWLPADKRQASENCHRCRRLPSAMVHLCRLSARSLRRPQIFKISPDKATQREAMFKRWMAKGGVVLIGFENFTNLTTGKRCAAFLSRCCSCSADRLIA
jgi:RAD54-like protein 2